MNNEILHRLQERIKELTALHRTAKVLQDSARPTREVLAAVARLLPPSWQYPEIAGARVSFDRDAFATERFGETPWVQTARFEVPSGERGALEVSYDEARPDADEGPFLLEERQLIDSLAEMLRSHFQHRIADQTLEEAHRSLECKVAARTAELRSANRALEAEVAEHRRTRAQVETYQRQLRQLASELCLAEERERRTIAGDLHDHIGQALAFMKLKLLELRSNAVFCGFEQSFDDIFRLLDQTIQSTRDLTFEISPPVLYEFGLASGLEWLCEQFTSKHPVEVRFEDRWAANQAAPAEEVQVTIYKAVGELVTNAVKHADCRQITVALGQEGRVRYAEVRDDGRGFDVGAVLSASERPAGFGLFSLRERMRHLGGAVRIASSPDGGTRARLTLPREQEVPG